MSAQDATLVFTTQERELIARREGLNLDPSPDPPDHPRAPLTPTETDSALGDEAPDDAAIEADRRAQVFARLVPSNDAARVAFHEVAQACRTGKLGARHTDSLFINDAVAGAPLVGERDGRTPAAASSSDSEDPASVDGREAAASLLHGHFEFVFDDGAARPAAHVGYRIGKGTSKVPEDRNVDILVVPPPSERSAQTKQLAGGIASIHSLIQVHPDSGVLMLVSGSSSRAVRYLDSDEAPLFKGQAHVLFRRKNTFWLGNLQFCFEYLVDPARPLDFRRRRDRYLRRLHPARPGPHPALLAVPRDDAAQQVDVALVHESLSSGAFGMVSAGVHKLTGAPLAVKEIWIKESRHVAEVKKEAEISNKFAEEHEGLLPTIRACCEHGSAVPCGKVPERFHIITPLALSNFAQQDWSTIDLPTRLRLFHDTLAGLRSLHGRGLMHRDVSPKNLLVVALDPPTAALCDYGKCVAKPSSANTYIGPVFTLAPEVLPGRRYDRRIDVWSLAYAWFRTLEPGTEAVRTDRPRLAAMLRKLQRFAKEGELQFLLAQLMERMLAWDPEQRIGVDEALAHQCMRVAAEAFPPSSASSGESSGESAPGRKRSYEE